MSAIGGSQAAYQRLCGHSGRKVRELQNVMERACAAKESDETLDLPCDGS